MLRYAGVMRTEQHWRWRLRDHRGVVIKSHYTMSETDALARDPKAERVPGSMVE